MANTITAFLETLVAAADDYNQATVGTLSLLDSVLKDVKPEVARMGQTIKTYFPDLGAFTDVSSSGFTDQNLNPNEVDLTFSAVPGTSFTVYDFEQFLTSVDILEKFIDPAYKRGAEYLNGVIAALFTTGNFTLPVAYSATPGLIDTTDATYAWNILSSQKVPMMDPADLRLVAHNNVYANMLSNSNWIQESYVGAAQAEAARQRASLRLAYNAEVLWDQQMSRTLSSAITGTVTTTRGSANVTGSGTSFTTATPVGTVVTFPDDTSVTPYTVKTVTDDTHIVLNRPFGSASLSGKTLKTVSYTNALFHKYAIGLALRQLPPPDEKVVNYQYVNIRGIPMRVMIGYRQMPKPGYTVTVDYAYAVAVLRPTFGVLISC